MQSDKKTLSLPVEVSAEERRSFFSCPSDGRNVTCYTCLQCLSFEVKKCNDGDGKCGYCKYPKDASVESQLITNMFYQTVNGISREDSDPSKKSKKKKGTGKLQLTIDFLKEKPSRSALFKYLEDYGISKAYMISLYSSATKKIVGYKEMDPKREKGKRKRETGELSIKDKAIAFLKATPSKQKLLDFLSKEGISKVYASTLYYTAKKEIKDYKESDNIVSKKKGKKSTGALQAKVQSVISLMQSSKKELTSKTWVPKIEKELKVSKAYASSLFYQAKKLLKTENK